MSEVSRVEVDMTKISRAEVDSIEVWPNLWVLPEPGISYGGPLLKQFYVFLGSVGSFLCLTSRCPCSVAGNKAEGKNIPQNCFKEHQLIPTRNAFV
ncbi:hypothetical protein KSB_43300 [Ktedonobacter robiniae]|uniref:Uncharacterized protein n=1 Tax=Ktedonobacter robiniae TaxID=2778365 RepID=A0ABQ3UU09_9CHLR|nr:hypothetical protein KSB_43300 [Ktedonobacter robiniae]